MHDENKKCVVLKPRQIALSTPAEEKTLSVRHASYSARIELKPSPQVPDGLSVSTCLTFWLKALVRRDMIQNKRQFHKYTYTHMYFLGVYPFFSTDLNICIPYMQFIRCSKLRLRVERSPPPSPFCNVGFRVGLFCPDTRMFLHRIWNKLRVGFAIRVVSCFLKHNTYHQGVTTVNTESGAPCDVREPPPAGSELVELRDSRSAF